MVKVDRLSQIDPPFEQVERENRSKTIPMAGWPLGLTERLYLFNQLFSVDVKRDLSLFRAFNLAHLQKTDAIVIKLDCPSGFAGDAIEDSRIIGAMVKKYPDNVFVRTDKPDLFGKYNTLTEEVVEGDRISFKYKTSPDSEEKERTVSNYFSVPAFTNRLIGGTYRTAKADNTFTIHKWIHDNKEEKNTHQLHLAQMYWESLFDLPMDAIPDPAISVPLAQQNAAANLFQQGDYTRTQNLIIHPDAHDMLYDLKHWTVEKWVSLIGSFRSENKDASIILSQGVDHPELTQEIVGQCDKKGVPVTILPEIDLATYAAFLELFPRSKTVFAGLESMPGGHLAPGLGLKSVVLANSLTPYRYNGPWNGHAVMYDTNRIFHNVQLIAPEAVQEAVEKSFTQLQSQQR